MPELAWDSTATLSMTHVPDATAPITVLHFSVSPTHEIPVYLQYNPQDAARYFSAKGSNPPWLNTYQRTKLG
jgi:hypothetical protein